MAIGIRWNARNGTEVTQFIRLSAGGGVGNRASPEDGSG
jgi:hypothetical protein